MTSPFRPLPRLKPGDAVALVAPAGLPRPDDLGRGLEQLSSRYRVMTFRDLHAIEPWGILAGPDQVRADELRWAATHPDVSCILAVRGGYGTARVVDGALLDELAAHPRLVVGFSDLTALLSGMLGRSLRAVHGPMACQLGGKDGAEYFEDLRMMLEEPEPPQPAVGLEPLVEGVARGPLVGGNLTVLTHLVGTELFPPLEGAVLLLEDVDERPYCLDRCLIQLDRAGCLKGLAGIVVGELTACEPRPPERTALEMICDFCRDLGLPAAAGLAVGHERANRPVPLGAEVELDATEGRLTFFEGAVV